jgi:hypothetical protein
MPGLSHGCHLRTPLAACSNPSAAVWPRALLLRSRGSTYRTTVDLHCRRPGPPGPLVQSKELTQLARNHGVNSDGSVVVVDR